MTCLLIQKTNSPWFPLTKSFIFRPYNSWTTNVQQINLSMSRIPHVFRCTNVRYCSRTLFVENGIQRNRRKGWHLSFWSLVQPAKTFMDCLLVGPFTVVVIVVHQCRRNEAWDVTRNLFRVLLIQGSHCGWPTKFHDFSRFSKFFPGIFCFFSRLCIHVSKTKKVKYSNFFAKKKNKTKPTFSKKITFFQRNLQIDVFTYNINFELSLVLGRLCFKII